jgi:thiol-disulfide isomerase/thioredoxin
MKSVITSFLALVLLVSLGNATEIFEYNDALSLSKDNNNKVLLYFGAEWCGYCDKMQEVLSDKDVSKVLQKNGYIFVKLDIDKHPKIKKKFSVKNIPDFIIIDKDENVLKRNKGYNDKNSFISWLID